MNQDNPTKRYYVQLPGYERGEIWDEDKYERNRDALFNEHKDAIVLETAPLAENDEISDSNIYTVKLPGYPQAESWDGQKMMRNREQLLKDHPDVEITSARPINYWGDKLGEIYDRIGTLNNELKGLPDDSAADNLATSRITTPEQAEKVKEAALTRRRKKEIKRELEQLYETRESNPAFQNYMQYLNQSIDDDYSRVDKAVKDEAENNPKAHEAYKRALSGGLPGPGGGARDPFAFANKDLDKDYNSVQESLAAAKIMLDDAKRTASAPSRHSDGGGFWKALAESAPESLAPVKLMKVGLNMHLIDAVKKIQDNEAAGANTNIIEMAHNGNIDNLNYLNAGEKELVKAFAKKADVEAAMSEQIGEKTRSRIAKSYQAGQSFGESIGFMTDFMMYGGVGNAAAEAVAGGLVKKAGRAALKRIGAETLYGTVKALAMTPLMPSSYYQFQQDLLQFNDAGGIDLSGKALRKAAGDVIIENISETVGAKPLELIALPLEKVKFPDWAKAMRNSPIAATMKQAGYNGLFEEIVEEWSGNALRVLTGFDKDALKDFATIEQQLITLGSFAPMSLFSAPMTAVQYHAASKQMRENGITLEEIMKANGMTDDEIKAAMNIDNDSTPEEIAAHMTGIYEQIVKNGGDPKTALEAVTNFTQSASQYKVMTGVMDEQKDIERSKRLLEIDNEVGSDKWYHTGKNGASFVRTITDQDGNEKFVTSQAEDGSLALVDRNGKPSFMSAQDYAEGIDNGTLTDSGESFLFDYLDRETQAQEKSAEATRIATETGERTKALLDNLQPGMQINIGSVESPEMATVMQVTGGKVIMQKPDGKIQDYTLDEIANYTGVELKPKTDAETENEEADVILQQKQDRKRFNEISKTGAYLDFMGEQYVVNSVLNWDNTEGRPRTLTVLATPVVGDGQQRTLALREDDVQNYISNNQDKLTTEEKLEEINDKVAEDVSRQAEDNVPRDFKGNPLPMRTNSVTGEQVVDGTTLWNNDPEAWAVWNDSNPNRKVTSKEKLEYNIKELEKEIEKDTKAIKKAALKGINEDDMDAMESALAQKVGRLTLLKDTLAKINKPAEAAQTVAGAERKAEAEKTKQKAQAGFPAIQQKWEQATKIVGAEDEIRLANGETISGHYVLTEANAPTPSHNPQDGFRKSNGFPVDENGKTVNDRDYERDKAAQKAVLEKAGKYDQRALQTPVIVTNDGVVLSGNDRTMASQIAAANNTDGAYVSYLTKYAQKYGFTAEQVKSMQHPRVVFVPDAEMPYNAATFSKFNAEEKKSQNKVESAVKAGKTISAKALGKLAALVNGYEDINALYNDENGTDALINIMLEDGYITPEQVAALKEGNRLSGTGMDFLEATLIGSALEEEAVRIVMNDRSVRNSIVSAIAQIIENSTIEGYNLRTELADAIALVADGKASKTIKFGDSVQGYIRQGNLFGDDVVAEATVQLLADALNNKKTTLLKKVLSLYNRDAIDSVNGQMEIWSGSVATKDDILTQILNSLGYDIRTFNTFERAEAAKQGKDSAGTESAEVWADDGKQMSQSATNTADYPYDSREEAVKNALDYAKWYADEKLGESSCEDIYKFIDYVKQNNRTKKAKAETPAYGSQNKIVTAERYEELKRQMRDKLNNLNAGFDPELLSIGAQMAAYHVEAGARKFVDFSRRMINDLGDAIRPYLKGIYSAARYLPGMEEYSAEMDSPADVDAIDVNKIQIEETPVVENAVETEEQEPKTETEEEEQPTDETERLNEGDLVVLKKKPQGFDGALKVVAVNSDGTYNLEYNPTGVLPVTMMNVSEDKFVPFVRNHRETIAEPLSVSKPVRAEQQPAAEPAAENLRPIEKFASENISSFNDEGLTDEDKKRAKGMFYSIWNGPGTNRDVKKREDIDERICVYYNPYRSYTKFLIDHGHHISFMDNDEIYMLDFDDAAGNKSPKIVATRYKEIKKSSESETTNVTSETETVGEVSPYTHTKTGEQMYIVRLTGDRLSSDEFKKLKSRAREHGGHYSSFGNAKGFLFKTEDDANKFNNITTTDNGEQTDKQTAAATTALVSEAATVAEQAKSLAEAEDRPDEGTANEVITKIDESVEKINQQLALLGYYKADEDEPFHESYGRMKSAERKAVKDADSLAKKLAADLGIEVGRKKLASANMAPAGGNITFRLPLKDGMELYVNIDLEPDGYTTSYGYSDNLRVGGGVMGQNMAIMYRIENPSASGRQQYITINRYAPYNVSYRDFLIAIRRVAKDYLPEQTVKPTTGPIDVLQVAKEQVEKNRKKGAKSEKKEVNSQKNGDALMGNLFNDLYDSESDTADDEVNTKTPENVEPTEVNGYKIGDKVLYTPIGGKRETQEATIYDFEHDGRPVLDTGLAPVMYEVADWENIKPIITSDNGTEGTDEVRTEGLPADNTGSGEREGESEGGILPEQGQEAGGTDTGGVQGGEQAVQPGRPVRRVPRLSGQNKRNNRISKGEVVYPKTNAARYKANVAAIRLMRELQDSGKEATKQQMEVLRQYTGWGGLGGYFNNQYSPEYRELQQLLTDDEIKAAKLSINTAYYTPVEVIDSMWTIAEKLGFEGGTILEGSAGIGNILASIPKGISDSSQITAVELDDITGGILKLLYPDATVLIKGFQEADIPNNSVDLAITNVPFGNINVYDSKEKDLSRKFGGKIHDFCIAKNIRKLAEGGIGIFISTRGTLDASSKGLRQWIVNEGNTDVIGAFRLNNETFEGTNATSDIIVVRKRVDNTVASDAINVTDTEITRKEEYKTGDTKWDRKTYQIIELTSNAVMEINSYYVQHPENMGGDMGFGFEHDDTYRPGSAACWPSDKIDQVKRLNRWAKSFQPLKGMSVKDWMQWMEDAKKRLNGEPVGEAVQGTKEGQLITNSKGEICVSRSGKAIPLGVNAQKIKGKYTKEQCLNDYDALKKAINETLQYEQTHETDDGLKPLLDKLNKVYDSFVKKYGYLNKNVSISFLRNDVDFASTAAVEDYKESKDINGKVIVKVKKNDLFNERVINAERIPTPSTVKDGVIVSMNKFGRIDIPFIANSLNKSDEDVKNEILSSGLGFENPQTGNIEVSYNYLSGNVREKLDYAKEHNTDGKYDTNIHALEQVIPTDIPAHLIEFALGSDWLPVEMYTSFAMEKFGASDKFKTVYLGGRWTLANNTSEMGLNTEQNRAAGVRSESLRMGKTGVDLMLAAMNNQTVVFSRVWKDSDGTQHTENDPSATQAASAKIADMRDDFREWARKRMLDDNDLAQRVSKKYNDTFNALVPKQISDEFVPERFDGQMLKRADGKPFSMRPYQAKAVIRTTTEPLMLAHEVGSGKTFTLIAAAMEMRRLGTAKKPMIVVQNATLGQFVSSAKELYPNAKVLTISESDRTVEGRSAFYAKIKYNDWDIIIVPQSVFEMMPDSEERKRAFIQEKIDEKMYVLEQAKMDGDPNIIRDIEKELEDLEYERDFGEKKPKKNSKKDAKREAEAQENTKVKAQKQLDRRTDEVSDFDDMGIDALLVDEAHAYKHLGFATSMTRGVKGVDPTGSKRAAGVYLKTRAVFDKVGWRNVVFATGTPISNTAAEIWTFMKYLMTPDEMRQYHIYYFDDFVRNFGAITQSLEFNTSGKFKETNRFASYSNLPELIRIWWATTDVVLAKDAAASKSSDGKVKKLGDELPVMETWTDDKGEKHENQARDIYLPQSPALVEIMKAIRKRLEEFEHMSGKEKKEKSHIPITMFGLAKQAAIDPRLVDKNAPDEPLSKTNKVVEEVLKALKDSEKYKGTAALFSDNFRRWDRTAEGRKEGFNLFEEIKRKLVEAGVPEDQIVIMKSGMNTAAKEKIFARVNAGDVRVIMGTTATLGTGVNIQERLHFLAHIDAPNRPMDYTQRNGRILRQGNLHKEWGIPVRVVRFGTEDSLDVTAYQRLSTKSKFINSVMDGKPLLENSMDSRVIEEEEEGEFENPVAILSGSEYALLKSAAERELRKLKNKKEQHLQDQIYIERTLKSNESKIKVLKETLEDNKKYLEAIKSKFPDGKVKKVVIEGVPVKGAEQIAAVVKDRITEPIREIIEYNRTRYSFKIGGKTFKIELDGVPVDVEIQVFADAETDNGGVTRVMRTAVDLNCPEIGIEDMHFPGGYINVKNVISTLEDNILSGAYHEGAIASNESTITRLENDDELMRQRRGKPFEDEEKLKKQEQTVAEYTELMKKEMKAKEKKYAEIASTSTSTFNIDDVDLDEDETEGEDLVHNSQAEDNTPRLDTSDPLVVSQAVSALSRLANKLGLNVRIVNNPNNNAKGSYVEGQPFVTINLANCESVDDAVEVLLHEGVAHFGLRKMLGTKGMADFINNLLKNAAPSIRAKIEAMAAENGWSLEYAAEEYIAELAEKTDYTKQERSIWRKIVQAVRDFIDMITGRQNRISEDTIREMLIASYENLEATANKGKSEAVNDESIDGITHYSIRKKPAPKKKGIGYKVFYRGKDGKLYPPMVANPNGEDTPAGVWLDADAAPVSGNSKTGRPQVKAGGKGTQGGSGTLAYRPGWHLGEIPYALQFNRNNPATGEKDLFPKDFVWAEVEYAADKNYQKEAEAEGINSNGKYQHSLAGLKRVPEDGYYTYRTNPNPATDPWIITGSMKVNRVLTRDEVDELVRKAGREPQAVEGDVVRNRVAETEESVEARNFLERYDEQDAEYMKAVEAGDMEKAQQMVADAFKAAYPDTKVVDKNGNPLVMYHGSVTAGFNEFKPREGSDTMGWFTTSKKDADSYAGNAEGKLYDSREKPSNKVLSAGTFQLGKHFVFDSQADLDDFVKRFPNAEEYMDERELDDAIFNSPSEKEDARLNALRDEFKKMNKAYRAYEREHMVDTTIGELLANPDSYSAEDFKRAFSAYDSNAIFDGIVDMEPEDQKREMYNSLKSIAEENKNEGGIEDIKFQSRVPRGGEAVKADNTNRRTYATYLNITDPLFIDAGGKHSEMESGDIYKGIRAGFNDDKYDGVIVRNWRVGKYQELGDVAIPKSPVQIKLSNPFIYDNNGNVIPLSQRFTESDDIRFRLSKNNRISVAPAESNKENKQNNNEDSQELFTSLYSKEKGYDYDKITELAERVIDGRTEMAYIRPEFRRAVRTIPQAAIAIITGRDSSAAGGEIPSSEETEQAVIEWAKREGYLIDEDGLDEIVSDDYKFRTGGEADVFIKETNKSVIKVYNQPDIQRFVGSRRNEEITKFNAAVPGSELDVIGVMDNHGVPAIVAKQKYIPGHTLENLNKRVWDYADELERKYDIILTPRSRSHDALGPVFEYDDLNEQNIIISDETGEPIIIDCWIDSNYNVSNLYDKSAKVSFTDNNKLNRIGVEPAESGLGYTSSIQGKRDAVTDAAAKCGIEVEFRPSSEMRFQGKPLAGRWVNGKMYICVEHCRDNADAVRTVLHEGVGHNGLRRLIGNENMTAFCLDLFKQMPMSVRRVIATDAVSKYGGSIAEAVEEYLAERAENLDYENEDYERNFWDKVRGLLRMFLAKVGINVSLSDRDVRWLMWQSYNANKQSDILNQAKRQVVANKLGLTLKQQSEKDEAIQIVRNRTADDRLSAANIYNREIAYWASRLNETWVDKDDAVNRLVEAIEKSTGSKAKAFEDVRFALNQQSSKGLAAIENYDSKYGEPMRAAIKKIMDVKGCSLADVERYVMLKHGLERNEVFAKRDAKEYYQNIFDKRVEEITDSNIPQSEKDEKIAKEKAKLDKHIDMVKAGTDSKYLQLRKQDYGGLTALYSEYDTILPFDPEVETNEEYQARVLQSRHPKYTYIDEDGNVQVDMEATEAAAEQEAHNFEYGYKEDTKELWKRINAATKATLKHQYDANMLSREQYEKVRDMFQYYVPLRGFADNTAEDMYDYYNSDLRNNFAPPLMKAKGRKTESESPFGYIGAMASSGIAADMKNETKLALYYFISNRGDNDLVKISDLWYQKVGEDENGKGKFSPVYYPYNEDMTTEEAKKAYEDWEKDMEDKAKKGEAFRGTSKLNLKNSVIHIDRKNEPSHIIRFKVGGRDKMMIINGNPRAAQAINNKLNVEMSSDYQKFFGKILRYFSGINTSYNPEFWLSNAQRDILFALMSVSAKEDSEYNKAFRKNLKKMLATVIPQRKDKKSGVYSLKKKLENGTLGDSEVEQMYREFVENGGVTGYTTLKNNEEWEQELRKYTGEDLMKMNAIKKVFEAVQKYGEAVEQMTRFAAYMTSREQGKDIKDAVNDAKELTVNFNRKGSGKAISFKEADKLRTKDGKKLNPFLKALVVGASWLPVYGRRFIMFFNASVQGLNAMYKLFKKNPTKMGLWTAGFAALGVIQALIHALLDDDDDYLDIPDYERRNNLLLGGNGVYLKWALPQEARIFYAMGDMAVNHALGREPHKSMLGEIVAAASDIAPLNPAEGITALTPSALNHVFEVLLNEDYKGAKIYNDLRYLSDEEKKRTPAYQKAYQSTGKPYMLISQFANWATGGDYADAGWLNINPAAVEHILQGATGGAGTTVGKFYRGTIGQALGEDFSVRNTPFLSRILTINDERYRNAHTTELFDYYKAEAEHTKKLINTYRNNGDDKKLDKVLDSKDYDIMVIYYSYRDLMSYYNDELKATTDRKQRKELMREQDAVRKEMIKEISEIDK